MSRAEIDTIVHACPCGAGTVTRRDESRDHGSNNTATIDCPVCAKAGWSALPDGVIDVKLRLGAMTFHTKGVKPISHDQNY